MLWERNIFNYINNYYDLLQLIATNLLHLFFKAIYYIFKVRVQERTFIQNSSYNDSIK